MILYLDCTRGVSGDMLLSSLLATGIPMNILTDELHKLGLTSYELILREKTIKDISTLNIEVVQTKDEQLRHLKDIEKIISKSTLSQKIKKTSLEIFDTLAKAEAKAHNTTIDKVHFHEIGAVDTIIDIVGTVALINHISPDKIIASKINLGSGHVKFSHGKFEVPAPAVKILSENMQVFKGNPEMECATPTGMAIIKSIATQDDEADGKAISEGYGSGSKSTDDMPTFLRAVIK